MDAVQAKEPESKTPVDGKPDDASDLIAEADAILKESETSVGGESGATKEPEDSKKKEEEPKGELEGQDPQQGDDAEGEGSQPKAKPKKNRGFKRRQSRLVSQRKEADKKAEDALSQLQEERQKRELAEFRLRELEGKASGGPLKKPNPDDYPAGEYDEAYLKAKENYEDNKLDEKASQKVQATITELAKAEKYRQSESAHYKAAEEMGNEDYIEREDAVVGFLGKEVASDIVRYFPGESHKIFYYLGAPDNAEEAEDLKEMFGDESTMIRGVAELGRILEKIKAPKTKTNYAPDPDTDLQGGAASPVEHMQQQLEKMRDLNTAGKLKDGFQKILKFKQKARDRGIFLE